MHFVILRSDANYEKAMHRLQTTPLCAGLEALGVKATMVFLSEPRRDIAAPSHVVFNYRDAQAFAAALEAKKRFGCKVLCFFSDLYDLSVFVKLADAVDLFLAPTALHRDIVQAAIIKPVVHVPEAVDPIALPAGEPVLEVERAGRLVWFGFPESFPITTRFLLPPAFELAAFDRSRFGIITAQGVRLMEGVQHITFGARTFYRSAQPFSYALLSHFCYDQMLNTFIKSPNRMVTSVVRGLVPLVSATPSYRALAGEYGLESLMFRGPGDLASLLRGIDYDRDVQRLGLAQVRTELLTALSPVAIAQRLLNAL